MKVRLKLIFLCHIWLLASIPEAYNQSATLSTEELFFKQQATNYQIWLQRTGLAKCLSVNGISIENNMLELDLILSIRDSQQIETAWQQMSAAVLEKQTFTLPELLAQKLSFLTQLPKQDLIISILNTDNPIDEVTFRCQIYTQSNNTRAIIGISPGRVDNEGKIYFRSSDFRNQYSWQSGQFRQPDPEEQSPLSQERFFNLFKTKVFAYFGNVPLVPSTTIRRNHHTFDIQLPCGCGTEARSFWSNLGCQPSKSVWLRFTLQAFPNNEMISYSFLLEAKGSQLLPSGGRADFISLGQNTQRASSSLNQWLQASNFDVK